MRYTHRSLCQCMLERTYFDFEIHVALLITKGIILQGSNYHANQYKAFYARNEVKGRLDYCHVAGRSNLPQL